ncbi:MAG: polyphosphate kinase 2 family protein [Acidobacteria bacterium]|nr:polyphosphate kinase 2 family protein [Acidobacteriota bacterium]
MSSKYAFKKSPATLLRVEPGFTLADTATDNSPGFPGRKRDAVQLLEERAKTLATLQGKLFAQAKGGGVKSLLLILQAMDTAGKGGIVSHVVGSVDPQGIALTAFKAPTDEEKSHDFLWRIKKAVPEAGMFGVFDRSHYEDVLIHRVHGWADDEEIERRYRAINSFEEKLVTGGTTVVKVMLNISKDVQKERLAVRLGDPAKHWKYSTGDLSERAFWPAYMDAYQAAFDATSTDVAPWYVVPADKKWYARLAVQELVVQALEGMDLQWPKGDFDLAEEKRRLASA